MERAEIKKYLETVRYHYFNVKEGGNICVATASNKNRDKIFFGVSFCSPKDRFSKVEGRMTAYKRLYQAMKVDDILYYAKKTLEVNESTMAFWFLESYSHLYLYPNWLQKQFKYKSFDQVVFPRRLPRKKYNK